MKKVYYSINIDGIVAKVYDAMLGISNKSTYEQWVALFNPTSTYEGSWDKGCKMLFMGTDEHGNTGGLVSVIVENIPNQFVSIRHYGLLQDGNEITGGADVEKWTGGFENYSFEEKEGVTTVTVDLDVPEDFIGYMDETYPKALAKLKGICEA